MRSEWRMVRVGDIYDTISRTYSGDDKNVVLINTSDVYYGKVLNHKSVPNRDLKGQFKKTFQQNDILYSEIRPINRRNAFVDFDPRGYIASTKLMVLRAKGDKVLPEYMFRFLNSNDVLQYLQSLAETRSGTFPQITFSEIASLLVPLPPLSTQQSIVDTLSCLDAKIDLNNRINENLEAQAQAIFKSWFVDFEPFQDGEFVKSELGLIPEGWEVCRLEDFMFFQEGPGIRHWQFVEKDGTPFINIRCIQGQDLDLKTANMVSREEANGRYSHFLVKEWDILMSTSGTLGRYAIVRKDHLPLCMNTSVIRFFPKHDFEHYSYTYGYITSWEFSTHLVEKGSGSVQLNFGPTHLKQISLVKPSEEVLRSYHELVFPMIKKTVQLRHQNSMLAALRDTLLPKLMSGEIEVPVD